MVTCVDLQPPDSREKVQHGHKSFKMFVAWHTQSIAVKWCVLFCAVAGGVWKLEGDGYVLFAESHGLANVRLPWLNALSFRTRQSTAVLMSVDIGTGGSTYPLVVQVHNCSLCYVQWPLSPYQVGAACT